MSESDDKTVAAHAQVHSSHYVEHYPAHGTRESDPHYRDFHEFQRRAKSDPELYQCAVGKARGDFSECTLDKPLEVHHSHVEWALQNLVIIDPSMLERQYPGVTDPSQVGAWIESEANLMMLCQFHHRGHGGAHVASASDWEAQKYVKGFLT